MVQSRHLGEAVRPVFAEVRPANFEFQGTGFFIEFREKQYFVTANHVVSGLSTNIFHLDGLTGEFEIASSMKPCILLYADENHDLAIFEASYHAAECLSLSDAPPAGNLKIGTIEYSRFQIDSTNMRVHENPSSRIGNFVRVANDTIFPFPMYELSYPALKGASGAPVVVLEGSNQFGVIGVVVANAQHELMPVQKYQYVGPDGEEETTHYYLPAALAVPVEFLKNALEFAASKVDG